ncbi:hypothetical protein PoB_003380300 [Plakobranchus ocellatus]|uniref:Uncharacterized protein n=1 Tax=Plakobranchus ocellatus TaxID=259542 RepID=A0AAV4AJ74_9GAST|nr:hypothetical protein PoB_003380300 [Plakobranchus ocellatus]
MTLQHTLFRQADRDFYLCSVWIGSKDDDYHCGDNYDCNGDGDGEGGKDNDGGGVSGDDDDEGGQDDDDIDTP